MRGANIRRFLDSCREGHETLRKRPGYRSVAITLASEHLQFEVPEGPRT